MLMLHTHVCLNLFFCDLQVPIAHVHTWVVDSQLFGFGADTSVPGVYLTIQSSSSQITPELKPRLLAALVPALQATFPGLASERVGSFFVDHDISCIGIGKAALAALVRPPSPWVDDLPPPL